MLGGTCLFIYKLIIHLKIYIPVINHKKTPTMSEGVLYISKDKIIRYAKISLKLPKTNVLQS